MEDNSDIICSQLDCCEKGTYFCLCRSSVSYLCKIHCNGHLCRIRNRRHRIEEIAPTNITNMFKLIKQLYSVREEAKKQLDMFKSETNKIETDLKNRLHSLRHNREMGIKEFEGNIQTFTKLIERAKRPISNKNYYDQLEYLLTNPDSFESEQIINQIKSPEIKVIKLDENKIWEKIEFYHSASSHLLNNYNSYCFDVKANKLTDANAFRLVYTNGISEENCTHPSFEPASRMMLISPNDLLITGSLKIPKNCHIFQISTKNLMPQNDLNHGRSFHAISFVNGNPTVIGGICDQQPTRTVESLINGRWYEIAPLNHPRGTPTASAFFGKVYVVGGENMSQHPCEVFNEDTERWEDLMWYLPSYRALNPGLMSVCENFIIIFNGDSTYGNTATKIDTRNEKNSIFHLGASKNFSYNAYIYKDSKIISLVDNYKATQIETWDLKEKINFRMG